MDDDLKEIFKEIATTQKQISKSTLELKESQKKTDEQMAKTDAQLAKTDSKLAKLIERVDDLSIMYGGTSNNQGKVAEEFFYNSLKQNPGLDGIRFEYIDKNITRSRNRIEEE